MNVDLGKRYEKIIEKAIHTGYAVTKAEVLRQALTEYDRLHDIEEIKVSKQDLLDIEKARREYKQGKYATEDIIDDILRKKKG